MLGAVKVRPRMVGSVGAGADPRQNSENMKSGPPELGMGPGAPWMGL